MITLDHDHVRRILVIKLRAIGDVILSTIVTKNLRLAYPDAHIDFLTEGPSRDVVSGNPFLDGVIIFDRKKSGPLALIRDVRERRYDLVIDLFGNPRSAILTLFSGARYRVGFDFRGRRHAYNIRVPSRGGTVHNTQFNLDAIEAIGIPVADRSLHLGITNEGDPMVDAFFDRSGLDGVIIGLSSGGGWYTKRWPLERFAALADLLVERHHASILLLWGPGQLDDVHKITAMMRNVSHVPPPTTIQQLAALLRRCTFVIANDSGPMHLATAVGTPVLGIFGPTNPTLQGPYGDQHLTVRREGLECLGCNLVKCSIGHLCMQELSVETVLEQAEHLMKKNSIPA